MMTTIHTGYNNSRNDNKYFCYYKYDGTNHVSVPGNFLMMTQLIMIPAVVIKI